MLNQNSEATGQGIQNFTNPLFGEIRTAGTADAPLFCLVDICRALELSNPSKVKTRLDPEDVQLVDLHALTLSEGAPDASIGNSMGNFITEAGLYDVILRSDSPKARPFRKWVTSEVLPAIRRQGGYIATTPQDSDIDILAKAVLIANKTIADKQQRIQMLEGENEHLSRQNTELLPKAQYTDEVLLSPNTFTFTEMAKELGIRSAGALLKKLRNDKIIYTRGGMHLPMAKYTELGLFATRTHRFYRSNGTPDSSTITVLTQKGRKFMHDHFRVPIVQEPIDASIFFENC